MPDPTVAETQALAEQIQNEQVVLTNNLSMLLLEENMHEDAISAALSASQAEASLLDSLIVKDEVTALRDTTEDFKAAAEIAKGAAELARDTALIQSGVYVDEPTGRAAVSNGQAFKVQGSGDVAAYEYRRIDASTSTLLAIYPSADYVFAVSHTTVVNKALINYFLARSRRRGGSKYVHAVTYADGKCAMGLEKDGTLNASNFKSWGFGANRRGGGTLRYTIIMDEDGRQILHHDADGLIDFEPSTALLAKMQQSVVYPLSDARGNYAISNIRKNATYIFAQAQDRGGNVYDARQLVTGVYDTFVLDRKQAIEGEGTFGQSNAGGTGTGATSGTKIADSQWPFSVLSFNAKSFQQGSNGLVSGGMLTDLIPLKDAVSIYSGQFPATMCAYAWAQRQAESGLLDVGRICWTAYEGDRVAAYFLPSTDPNALGGGVNWDNYMTFATRAKAMAEAYGRTIVFKRVRYIQGEAAANWQRDFTAIADNIGTALKAISGQTGDVQIMLWQIVGVSPDNGVGQLQHDVAISRADCDLVAMMYPAPVSDVQHLTAEGRMMVADAESEYRKQVALGKTWNHMYMQTATRVGAVVTITVALPPGVNALSKFTDFPPQITQDGFVYRDSGGDTAINSIAYSGNTITLTLASTPSGSSPVVRYGMDNGVGVSGWYQLGGNVGGATRTESDFWRQGYTVPQLIRHYLARQSITVS